MKYYSLQHSLNHSVMGHYPQIKDVLYHCNVDSNPLFIGNFHYEKINLEPIVANPILFSKSNLTDLIYIWHTGFSFTKLISTKLKDILVNKRKTGLQFIKCQIFKNTVEYNNYWLMNMYEFNMDTVDFSKSKCSVRIRKVEGGTHVETLNIASLDDFDMVLKHHKEKMEIVTINNIYLNDNIKEDFFMLRNVEGGVKYIVSENLKNEIEVTNCTGIEFMPIELTLNEWLATDGQREQIYGKA